MATAAPAADPKKKPAPPRDHVREAVETVVFVVVLVLLLKLFVTEAFVIPTGSMAETLYGIQKIITCQKCGFEFPVNSHDEVEGQQGTGRKQQLVGYCCPNCRYHGRVTDLTPVPASRTGDRVLVLKPIYHFNALGRPARGDVVVFKFPKTPQERWVAA
ncbi:MAG TPA: S26 family signal peptidase, partial [Urbifossiella sp.]|nr:S26 family signal peptidase [Urbifossiella sp.]